MMEKFIATINDNPIALRWDPRKKRLVIGGKARQRRDINMIITDVLRAKVPRIKYTQSNKIRYTLSLSEKAVDYMLDALKEKGHELKSVSSHGYIMR